MHPEITNAALEKLSKHLWYLHKQRACLALFDNTGLPEKKLKIAKIINSIVAVKKSNKYYSVRYKTIFYSVKKTSMIM